MVKKNDVYKFVLKPGVPGTEIDNIAKMVDSTEDGVVNVKYPARENRRASLYAVFRVGHAPDFAKTTATYTVIKEKQDLPAMEWDDGMKEWIYSAHPPEPTSD